MKKRVADIIVETLVELDVDDCFCVVGGNAMYLNNALGKNSEMKTMFNHHEQACAIAAEAYARDKGKMAAVCVTSGPGATNALTGVMGAYVDSLPMIVLSGQVRSNLTVEASGLPLRFRGNQEFNIIDSISTMTKYAKRVLNPLDIKAEIIKSVSIALAGRRGPVWLEIPLDIQMAEIEEDELTSFESIIEIPSITNADAISIIDDMKKAKRPVILAGNGIAASGTLNQFRDFALSVKTPVVSAAIAADVLDRDYELYYGISGFIGPRTGNFVLQNSDYILCLGTSMGVKTTGYQQDEFAKNAKITMIDVDPYEVKKPGVRVDKFVLSGLSEFFDTMKNIETKVNVDGTWIEYCNKVKNRFTPFEAIEGLDPDERVCSYNFWKVFEDYEPQDSITALGNNTGITAKLQIGIKQRNQRIIANNNCGSMGYDIPAAIGIARASKKEVVCVTGDGSIMMNLQELQTIKHYDLPIKIVVFTNDGYNAIRQTSKNFFNGEKVGCDAESGVSFPEFSSVAKTFGYQYHCCHKNSELDESLKWLFNIKGHAILEVEQRLDDPVTPKVMSRVNENGEFVTPAIQDMFPFIDEKELDDLMLEKVKSK